MKNHIPISLIGILILSSIFFPTEALLEESPSTHRAPQDTVEWISSKDGIVAPPLGETDIEGPGEELGLIGPIIAKGGKGKNEYIAVYDPAGVLVGIVSKKDAKKHPEHLIALVHVAQRRAEIQNKQALLSMWTKAKARQKSGQ